MILPAQTIAGLCQGPRPLISPFEAERLVISGKSAGLSAASYDCRIDHDLVLGVNPAHIIAAHIMECGFTAGDWLKAKLKENPPNSALAYTVEDFDLPADISGAVCDKSSYARVFVSAFNTFFDPGFHGNATLELVNLGTDIVVYKKGDPVCQFLFSRLEEPTEQPYNGKYQHQSKHAHGPRYEVGEQQWLTKVPPGVEFNARPGRKVSGLEFVQAVAGQDMHDGIAHAVRDRRQDRMEAWVAACFGPEALHPYERAERVLEEALELAQCEGVDPPRIHAIAHAVYAKPPGTPGQEIGGVATCLLAYAQSRGISADTAELRELTRITKLPPEHFRARHAAKFASGLAIQPPSQTASQQDGEPA